MAGNNEKDNSIIDLDSYPSQNGMLISTYKDSRDNFQNLVNWMNEGGAKINLKLAFSDDKFVGAISSYNIMKEERVLFVPYDKLLTFEHVSSTIMG